MYIKPDLIVITEEETSRQKVALVTGSSSGIGKAVVQKLSCMNYHVIAVCKDLPYDCFEGGRLLLKIFVGVHILSKQIYNEDNSYAICYY